MLLGLFGCGKQKYQVITNKSGFKLSEKEYAAGEKVTAYYDMIGTDTDYSFSVEEDDVKLKQDYDDKHGYVLKFTMPEHDVHLNVSSHGSMTAMPLAQTLEFTFTSRIEEADIWIIPDTQENRKTTLWGTATIKALAQDDTAAVTIYDLSEDGKYLLRVIDHDSMYYSADAIEIPEGGSIELKELDGPMNAELEVFDADGASVATYEVFMARL